MGVVLPPLEFTECLSDSPYFRENLHKHERELEKTNQHIKRIIKEVKDLLAAAKQLSIAQRSFAKCLQGFTFECIGGTQTDDEQVICASLNSFSELILQVEDERDRMLENANTTVVKNLEDFRKKYIGGVKNEKKKFEKQTAKFCQNQERYLNLTTKKTNSLQEADASVDMAERHFYAASMDYVYLIQEVHERKKFEFVETLLTFIYAWFTFYHQGYELKKDYDPNECLRCRNKTSRSEKNAKGCREGYLFLLEKKAFGTTWTKHYCKYDKETKEFSMLPYNQLTTKSLPQPETMVLTSCVRRMSDSIEKRFCFDIQLDSKPGVVFTFQALSEQDRKAWMDIMDGKEPTYTIPSTNTTKIPNSEERQLDETGIQFVKKCIEVLESRGLEEQGIYRVVGVSSKVNKLLHMGLDRRKGEKLCLDDPLEWETKTITSALKTYLRNLPEPLMTYRYHNGFIAAVKSESKQSRVNDVHTLIYRLPKANFEVLKILMKHLTNVVAKCDKNLMTVSNLGVCFGPTLLRPEEETVASILDLKFYNIVVEILIENYERIFFNEPEKMSPVSVQANTMNGPSSIVSSSNTQSIYSPPNNHLPTYIGSDETVNANRAFINNGHSTRISPNYRTSYNQPYTCTVTSYIEPPISSSMHSVHDPANGIYAMSRSEHVSNRPPTAQQRLKHYVPSVTSQSETNLPNLRSYSPTNFRAYNRLDPNSTSSSNESLSSTSRDNFIGVTPKKSERSSVYMGYPKMYKSPGNVRVRTLYACLGEHDGELSFEPNQIITNVKVSQEPGWLEGTLNGKTGLVPENYVEFLP
ncbi:hypothetical protein NQ315_007553 [Exocentrus adspersus]|uniref:Rho GTPase-activating protein 26 n=1 Tax=Exocentrus adspersus TaxID=1586481 RepID=A0AAV8W7A2_9CUCU|nr:hypothetical protein NQ315_007553 [Exocentrus adspersus]